MPKASNSPEESNGHPKVFQTAEEAAESIAREEIPEPPPGADPALWDSISPEMHREASRVAQVLLGNRPRKEGDR